MLRRKDRARVLTGGLLIAAAGGAAIGLADREAEVAAPPSETRATALLEDVIARSDPDAFPRPSGAFVLSLPEDYGAHPEARAETWMLAAHLRDSDGTPSLLHFSLSRYGLRARAEEGGASPWDLHALYRGHLAMLRAGDAALSGEERFSRGAGAAGHDQAEGTVWLDHWQLRHAPEGLTLTASLGDTRATLRLTPLKSPVQTGGDGAAPVRGFALTRMAAEGRIGARAVQGHAWLDRLWGDLPMPGGPLAYDRLILQLGDGTDLSLLRSHRPEAPEIATLDGLIVHASGDRETFSGDRVSMVPTAHWPAPGADTGYPVAWRIRGSGLDLRVVPLIEDQAPDFDLPMWLGAMRVLGTHGDAAVEGQGTLQMTGYEDR